MKLSCSAYQGKSSAGVVNFVLIIKSEKDKNITRTRIVVTLNVCRLEEVFWIKIIFSLWQSCMLLRNCIHNFPLQFDLFCFLGFKMGLFRCISRIFACHDIKTDEYCFLLFVAFRVKLNHADLWVGFLPELEKKPVKTSFEKVPTFSKLPFLRALYMFLFPFSV